MSLIVGAVGWQITNMLSLNMRWSTLKFTILSMLNFTIPTKTAVLIKNLPHA